MPYRAFGAVDPQVHERAVSNHLMVQAAGQCTALAHEQCADAHHQRMAPATHAAPRLLRIPDKPDIDLNTRAALYAAR